MEGEFSGVELHGTLGLGQVDGLPEAQLAKAHAATAHVCSFCTPLILSKAAITLPRWLGNCFPGITPMCRNWSAVKVSPVRKGGKNQRTSEGNTGDLP